jgi:carbon-monoxide dehydrogenase large subunit
MLECRAVTAVPDGRGVTVYVGHQNGHKLQRELVAVLDLEPGDVRIVVPEVGGGFGAKSALYPEYVLAAYAALCLGHPVKYIETRTENMLVTTHGRGQTQRVEIGAMGDGTLTALRAEIDVDFGAAADLQRWCAALTRHMLSGAYRIPRIEWSVRGVLTHTAPLGPFRGAGRPEAAYLVERAVDEVAAELGMDPAAVREANFIAPNDFPYQTGTGATYDSGAYATAMRAALDIGGYEEWRRLQAERRAGGDGTLIGIGIASYVELAAGGEEYAAVAVADDGTVEVRTGTSPHGQGHHTAWAQLAAERVGVAMEAVTVSHGDTAVVPRGGGTSGSRSAAVGGSAVAAAADRVAARLRDLAADRLEASSHDIRLDGGRAAVAGTDVTVTIADLVADAGGSVAAEEVFASGGQNFPFGTHLCVVEVTPGSGEVTVVGHVAVDDCGRVLNPLLVEGQIHGGVMQGVSYALAEEARFDEDGQPQTTGLHTYRIPAVAQMVPLTSRRTETPSPVNPLGMKGVGESGITGATPAVANAVFDALRPLGVGEDRLTMPFTPDRVWAAVTEGGR